MEHQKVHEVRIFGEVYKLVSDSEFERIKDIARIVDEKMQAVAKRHPNFSKTRVAVLVALNLADELTRMDEKANRYQSIEHKIEEMTKSLKNYT